MEEINIEELEDRCICWVCFEIFKNPITLYCSHSLCKECAEKIYKKTSCCPFCKKSFNIPLPDVNKELENLVNKLLTIKENKNKNQIIEQNSIIFSLPYELIIQIFLFLSPKEISKISKVSRQFREITNDSWLWREICQRSFPFCSVDKYGKNWKWCYISRSNIQKGWEQGKAGDFQVTTFRGHTNYINSFRLYRNFIVSGSADNNLKLWKVDSPLTIHTLVGHSNLINCVEFNEIRIISGSEDQQIKLWDTKTGLLIKTIDNNEIVHYLQFDDNKLICGGQNNVKMWDFRESNCLLNLQGHLNPVNYLIFNNEKIISGSLESIRIWDIRNGNLLNNFQSIGNSHFTCFQMIGNQIIAGFNDGKIRKYDINTGNISLFNDQQQNNGYITTLQCDNKYVINGTELGKIMIWDLNENNLIKILHEHSGKINSLKFVDNKMVSGSADNSIKVWNISKGNSLYSLLGGSLQRRTNNPEHPHKKGCSQLDFDDSRIVASFASLLRSYDFEHFKPPNTF